MRRDLGVLPAVFPMPVLMIGTYDGNGKVNVMNMAWGNISTGEKIVLNMGSDRKTLANIRLKKAFSVALADVDHIKEADYFGIVSGNKVKDKFERTGFHAVKGAHVDAPVIQEFPLTMECELLEEREVAEGSIITGRIVNVNVDEKILNEKGTIVAGKLNAVMFDQFERSYYKAGKQFARAWNAGAGLVKK